MSALAPVRDGPAPVGDNKPPSPFDTVKVHMEDLLTEARNWADGVKVETQAQADDVSRLIEDLRLALDAADDVRKEEKRPLDDQIAEIQDRYNVYIAPLKNKTPGKLPLAMDALKAVLKPFLDAQEGARLAEAKRLREEQEVAAALAAKALRAAAPDNLEAREEAEELVTQAAQLAAQAKATEAARPMARGGSRGLGLKKTYTAEIENPRTLLLHYWEQNREPIVACLLAMAQADVDRHVHTIPGVKVNEGTRL